jgi:hypothetical protein
MSLVTKDNQDDGHLQNSAAGCRDIEVEMLKTTGTRMQSHQVRQRHGIE